MVVGDAGDALVAVLAQVAVGIVQILLAQARAALLEVAGQGRGCALVAVREVEAKKSKNEF